MPNPVVRPLAFEHSTRTSPAIVATLDGVHPALVTIRGRMSRSAPARARAQLVHRLDLSDGRTVNVPVCEFRLEMN